MKTPVRELSPIHTTASILLGIAAAVVCVAHLSQAARGLAWDPTLAAAAGTISLISIGGLVVGLSLDLPFHSRSSASSPVGKLALGVFEVAVWVVWWAAACVFVSAGFNWWRGTNKPLEPEAVRGSILGATILLVLIAQRRGWLRGVLFDPKKSQESKKKQEALARLREEMLAAARQSSTN